MYYLRHWAQAATMMCVIHQVMNFYLHIKKIIFYIYLYIYIYIYSGQCWFLYVVLSLMPWIQLWWRDQKPFSEARVFLHDMRSSLSSKGCAICGQLFAVLQRNFVLFRHTLGLCNKLCAVIFPLSCDVKRFKSKLYRFY